MARRSVSRRRGVLVGDTDRLPQVPGNTVRRTVGRPRRTARLRPPSADQWGPYELLDRCRLRINPYPERRRRAHSVRKRSRARFLAQAGDIFWIGRSRMEKCAPRRNMTVDADTSADGRPANGSAGRGI
eukprot:scaffold4410_cov255-Prasinococcus_capsulatus_cf.AAC.1